MKIEGKHSVTNQYFLDKITINFIAIYMFIYTLKNYLKI